jgi:glycosyltransferase involved in cell wall biosynthesis
LEIPSDCATKKLNNIVAMNNSNNFSPHVLFLTKWYPNKFDVQLGVFIRKHAKAVSKYCKVSVLYVWGDNDLNSPFVIEEKEDENFFETIIYYQRNKGPFKLFVNFYLYLKHFFKGYRHILEKQGKIDLIHIHILIRTGLAAWLLKARYNIPYLISEQWTGYTSGEFSEFSWLRKYLVKRIIKNAKVVTVVSESLKNNMLKLGLKNNYEIVHNIIEDIELPKEQNNEKIKILTVADLNNKNKNISGTINAISEVYKIRQDFEFYIIGGGNDENYLKSLADKAGLLNKVIFFKGRKTNEEVYEFFKKIDFVIINSNVETFCVAAAEALVNGKPQITTKCGGPEEFIKPEHGILIEKGNHKQLVDAILYMLDNYKNYDRVAMSEYAKRNFSYEGVGKKFYQIYQQILNTN